LKKLAPRKEVGKRCFEDSSKANPKVRETWVLKKLAPRKEVRKRCFEDSSKANPKVREN